MRGRQTDRQASNEGVNEMGAINDSSSCDRTLSSTRTRMASEHEAMDSPEMEMRGQKRGDGRALAQK